MSYKLNPFTGKLDNTGTEPVIPTVPASIDDLNDVDTSTVAPTDGQALVWDNANSQWEPGTVSGGGGGAGLPTATTDGKALIVENGQWVEGPVIGGVDYNPSGDADFASVELLLYGEGAESGTVFTDSSNNNTTITRQGLAFTTQLQTDPFGDSNGVIELDPASSDYLTFPSTNFQFGTDDFTFETFFKLGSGWTSNGCIIAFPVGEGGSDYSTFRLEIWGTSLRLLMGSQPLNSWPVLVTGTTTLVTNQWYHVAVDRNGVNATVYLDGAAEIQTTNVPATMGTTTGIDGRIGYHNSSFPYYFDGYISNLRITKGVRRYTTTFTPPTSKFLGAGTPVNIPYSIDNLDDVDTSTVVPTIGQVLGWDGSQWEPTTPSTSGLPSGTTDGQALIWENGDWSVGPLIGGVNYTTGQTPVTTYTVPTGYQVWGDTWQVFPSGSTDITLSNGDLTALVTQGGTNCVGSNTTKSSGKWYWELLMTNASGDTIVGIKTTTTGVFPGGTGSSGIGVRNTGANFNSDSIATLNSGSSTSYGDADIIMFALDMDAGELYMGVNGTWAGSSDPNTSTSPWASSINAGSYYFIARGSIATEEFTINSTITGGSTTTDPYDITKLDDVDTTTTPPTLNDVLQWDGTNWVPAAGGGGGGSSLPTANDGEALIYENGAWVAGPVIGGVAYTPSADPNYSDVEVLLSMDGTDGSTTFTDSGPATNTITVSGNAAISTTQSKFGGASGDFSSGGYLYDTTGTYDLTGSAWTVECWAYYTSTPSVAQVVGTLGTSNTGSTCLFHSGGVLYWQRAGTGTDQLAYTWTPTLNQWYHLAVCWDGTTLRIFIDGTEVASNTAQPAHGSLGLNVGGRAAGDSFPGYLDDVRITSNVARYTANFTPPTLGFAGNHVNIVATGERKTSSVTTSSLATNASADVTLPLTGKAGQFVSVTVDYPAWVVFYTDAAARTADASRAQTTDALPGSGVLLEVATSTAGETVVVTPSSGYFNNESTPVSELSIKVVNLDSVARAITVDAKVIPLEA